MFRAARSELLRHVGANPSVTQTALVDRAAWLTLHVALLDAKVIGSGNVPSEFESRQYLAWSNSLSRALRDLGLKSAAERPRSLQDHIAARQAPAA